MNLSYLSAREIHSQASKRAPFTEKLNPRPPREYTHIHMGVHEDI
jgi:hypothetical protein